MTTELPPQPKPQPIPNPQPNPQPTPDPTPEPKPGPGTGRWIALGTALVLSAVVVGGGVGLAVLSADNSARHPVAAASARPASSPAYGALSNGNHFGDLADLLLPMPLGFVAGPDEPGVGNDTVLTTAQYHGIFDKDLKSLSSSDRQALESYFNAGHIKGDAVRTYRSSGDMSVEIELRQENQQFAAQEAGFTQALAGKTGAFRAGPAIPGFPKTHCYLPPLPTGDKLDYLDCDASVGDMYVRMEAYGVAPLNTLTAADLLRQQLTRLAIPGAQT